MTTTVSAREAVMSAIGAILSEVPSATFFRSREAAFARSEGTAITLQPEEERVEKRAHGTDIVLRNLMVVVGVIARGDQPDQIADAWILQVHAVMMADPTLGGLCSQIIEHGTKWTFQEADQTAVLAEIRYEVRYLTRASDLLQAI